MAKKKKHNDPDEDDDIYLAVKREICNSPHEPQSANRPGIYMTPTSKISSLSGLEDTEGTPCTAKFSKETKSALKIVRKHSPSIPLYKTAVGMISTYVLANKTEDDDKSVEGNAFDCIEQELSRKSTPRDKMTLVIKHVRDEVGCMLARSWAHFINDGGDLARAILAVRAAAEKRTPGIAESRLASDKDQGAAVGKRKRKSSGTEAREPLCKVLRADESSSIGSHSRAVAQPAPCAKASEAKKCFNRELFLAMRLKAERMTVAKKYFVTGEDLLNFHLQQLHAAAEHDASETPSLRWSALSDGQKQEWQQLLDALHGGSKLPVTKAGTALLERQQATIALRASGGDIPRPAVTSSSDESESEDRESDWDTAGDKTTEGSGERTHTASQSEYAPTAVEAARVDGLPRKAPWTVEEKRILLKGMYHGWSNEKIASELPHTSRKRTALAVACQKSNMKKRHPNGVPVIRADTPFPLAASPSAETPRPVTPSASVRRSTVGNERPRSSAASRVPYLIPTPQAPNSLQWPVHVRADRPRPTFIRYRRRPPLTAETRNLEYLLLPIETPECPALHPAPEDVTKACEQAFDKSAAFRGAQKLDGALWVASFDRSDLLLVPMRRLSETTIHFRGYRFRAHYLSFKPPRTFVADIPQEAVAGRSSIVAAIHGAFGSWPALPQLALHAIARPRREQLRRIVARFHGNPGLVQFYIPVQMGSSQRWLHIRFEPLDLTLPCWHCGGSHHDGWCDKAKPLSYPDR